MWGRSPAAQGAAGSVFRVACLLAYRFNRSKGAAWPSLQGMADELGLSERTVWAAVKRLTQEDGPFLVEKRRGCRPARYTLRKHEVACESRIAEYDESTGIDSQGSADRHARSRRPYKEETGTSETGSKTTVSSQRKPKHSPEEIDDVTAAVAAWTESKGQPPTWVKGKQGWTQMYEARSRAGTDFLPAWRKYLADPTPFVAEPQHPPGLFLCRLDGYILGKARTGVGVGKPTDTEGTAGHFATVPERTYAS